MNDITPLQAIGAFLLLLAVVLLVLCASALAMSVWMVRAPWRRIERRRADLDRAELEVQRRQVLDAIMQHDYGSGDAL